MKPRPDSTIMVDDPHDDEYIQEQREKIIKALQDEGIDPEELTEMTADEALDVIGRATLNSGEFGTK